MAAIFQALGMAFAMPIQAFLGTYMLLNRESKRLAYGLTAAAWSLLTLFLFDIGSEQLFQLGRPSRAPRKRISQDLLDRRLGVYAS